MLTRSRRRLRRDPRELGSDRRADRRDRAGARVRAARDARRAARRHRQQAAALPARRGAVGRRRASSGVQLRFEGAVAGVVPVIRVLQESLAGRRDRPRARDRQRHDQLHPHRDGPHRGDLRRRRWPRPSGSATPRPIRPRTSTAGTPRPRWRSSPGWRSRRRSTSTRSATRGSRQITARRPRVRARPRARAEADRDRRARRRTALSVRVHPAFLYPGHPLASVSGPFNAVTVESEAITEITMSGPGAGGPQTASAVLGDVISAMIPPRLDAAGRPSAADRHRRRLGLLPAPRGRRRARACWPAVAARAGRAGRVGQVGGPEGPGATRRGW